MTLLLRKNELKPWRDVFDLQNDLGRLFDLNFGRLASPVTSWAPALDLYEEKDDVVVKAELPGMEEKEVEISFERDTLTIRGEKKQEQEVKEDNYYHLERSYGKFQRSVVIPSHVDANAAKATFKNGVLEIRLPKKEEVKPRQIRIEASK